MFRVLASAAVLAGLLAPTLVLAQPRASHSGFSGGARFYRSAPTTVRPNWTPWQGGRSRYFAPRFFPFRARSNFGIMPAFPLWWPSTDTDNGDGEPAPAAEEPSDTDLSTQIGNLAAEVQMLREEQAQAAQPAEPAPPPEPPPATVLVYRDGRQVEVVNFAILGQTLFVFSGQKTERVPLSDLDLTATERVNNDRGVEFNLPTEK